MPTDEGPQRAPTARVGIATRGRHNGSALITATVMRSEPDSPEHHRQRSEFIRSLVQTSRAPQTVDNEASSVPNTIVQFWHDSARLPEDVR